MQAGTNRRHRVLYIDGDTFYARLVQESLRRNNRDDLEIVCVEQLDSALEQLQDSPFDAVLIDPWRVDSDSLESCLQLIVCLRDIPIVVIADDGDEAVMSQAIDIGAQDYLVKGEVDGEAICRALRFAIERFRFSQSQAASACPVSDGESKVLLLGPDHAQSSPIDDCLDSAFGPGRQVVRVGRMTDAIKQLVETAFNLAVVDLDVPDSRGIETCTELHRQAPGLPLIVYADSDDEALALKTIRQGASDYLVKGRTSKRQLSRSMVFATHRQRRIHRITTPNLPRSAISSDRHEAAVLAIHRQTVVSPSPVTQPKNSSASRAPEENRRHNRYLVVRSVLAIPMVEGRLPDWKNRMAGFTCNVSREGMGLELDASQLESRSLMIGVERNDGVLCYAGMEVCHTTRVATRRLSVGGRIGGWGQEILDPANLALAFDGETKNLVRRVPDDVLAAWCEVDVLRAVLLDRVLVCPRCRALPTFRSGCRSCGSGRIGGGRLIHHFACAHVGPVAEFERTDELVCPKCRTRRLIMGTDFEYQTGLVHCQDCHWNGTDPDQVGQCLRCGFRFPGGQALEVELTGYHVHRLDPLAFISAP